MNLVERAKNIILAPAKEWDVIKGESLTIAEMFTKYAMILAAIPAVAGLIGYVVIGMSFGGFGTFRWPIGTALVWAVLTYVLGLAGVFLLAFIIDALAPTFGCQKNMVAAVKIAVFSYTPAWIAGILGIIPALSVLMIIASIYSLYLMYLGLQKIKEPAKDKLMPYLVAAIVAMVVIYWLVGFIVSRIALGSISGLANLGGF
ncbi:MAG TPA: Yip1 family protein [Candidatus Aminicenantes bacterium]|nr:Yip1 family protein [Candidatus Aminicenantes bacterium]